MESNNTKADRNRHALRGYRINHGLTLLEMSKRIDISQANLSRIESGNVKVSDEKMKGYLEKLGMNSLEELLTYQPTEEQKSQVELRIHPSKMIDQRDSHKSMMQERV